MPDKVNLAQVIKKDDDKFHVEDAIYTITENLLKLNYNPNNLFVVNGTPYIYFPNGELHQSENGIDYKVDNFELMELSTKSENLKAAIIDVIRTFHNHILNDTELRKIIRILHGIARKNKQEFYNRIAYIDGILYYDMADNKHTIKISSDGWTITEDREVIFARYSHQRPQVMPVKNGDPFKLLDYMNIQNESDKMLMMCYFITCYLSNIQQVLLQMHGESGSGKTSIIYVLVSLIDTSDAEFGLEITSKKELVQNINRHYFVAFDNVSNITPLESDIIARAVTGYSGEVRKLYTDNEAIHTKFKRKVFLSGLNIEAYKNDVMDRSLIMELELMDNRIDEKKFYADFEKDKAEIFGGVLDTLVEVLKIVDDIDIKLDVGIRMTSFARYGYAVAEVLGYGGDKFLEAYNEKFIDRDLETIQNSIVGQGMLSYLEHTNKQEFVGKPEQFRKMIENCMAVDDLNLNELPKSINEFSRQLWNLKQNFKRIGVDMSKKREDKKVNPKRPMIWTIKDNNWKIKVPPINSTSLNEFIKTDNSRTQAATVEQSKTYSKNTIKRLKTQ